MKRVVFLIAAYVFVGLAIIGVFLPGIPTVPFLLLAAWCSARGSERLHRWLYAHPQFGSLLIDWEEHGAVSRKNKTVAVVMLIASWIFLYFTLSSAWLLGGITLIFLSVSTFLLTRPEPR
ncbi:MAG: YbaN family protein [Pseudomonadota bacterium]